MGHTHTAIAGHVRAAHALRRIAAAVPYASLRTAPTARELSLAARARYRARWCARSLAGAREWCWAQRSWHASSLAAHTRLPWLAPRPCPFVHCSWHTTQGRAAALCSCTTPLLIAFVPHGRRAPLLVVACPHYTTPLKGNTKRPLLCACKLYERIA